MTRCVIDSDGLFVEEQYFDDGRQSIEAELPEYSDGKAARWNGSKWEIIPDYRGQIVYSNGCEIFWDKAGELPEGVSLTGAESVDLSVLKSAKISRLNSVAQAFINTAAEIDKVPDFEVQTWALQAAEVRAWATDKTASTPILDQIAASRGIDADKLKEAALRKTLAYEKLTAHVAGQRQALQSKIEAAKTQAALDKIAVVFTLPEAV
jgi:hypothetical protein